MKFTPLPEDQLRRHLAVGPAQFEIIEASEGYSKKSDPMLTIKLRVWDADGTQGFLTDYILLTDMFMWKFKALLDSVGKGALYEKGDIDPMELVGGTGTAKLYLQKSKDPKYSDRIAVNDYLVGVEKPSSAVKEEDTPF